MTPPLDGGSPSSRAASALVRSRVVGTRLLLAEDNLLVREGLVGLLGTIDDVELVGACASLPELLEAVERVGPDVVVTDIRMPPDHGDEGIRAARSLRASHPEVGVVVLSQFVDPSFALDLLGDGTRGRGYLLKDHVDEIDRLADAIRAVASGGSFLDDDVVDALVRSRTRMVDSPLALLTPRELEVLSEMATGATNAVIAGRLGIGAHAVEKHSGSIFSKLGLAEDVEVNRRVSAVLVFLGGARPGAAGP